MVKSSKNADKFDFIEFAHSKRVIVDLPKIISVYEKLIPVLQGFRQYTVAGAVLDEVLEALTLAEIQYQYYSEVYRNKGLIKNSKDAK